MMTSSGFDVFGEEITVDGALLSAKLGLTEEQLKHAMDRGQVTAEVGKGVDEDAGRLQATFRYRGLRWVVVVEVDGNITESVSPVREVPLRRIDPRLRWKAREDDEDREHLLRVR
jgi:non-canonical (house-cleaning) NTP pyrophosphatase